jgi:hypothetical protein
VQVQVLDNLGALVKASSWVQLRTAFMQRTRQACQIQLSPHGGYGVARVSPYAKIVLPSVEAAEQEVPRQMQLKLAEVLVAEQRRCLGCGHEYALQEEVVYHDDCMHHHCMCCETEPGSCSCYVSAQRAAGRGQLDPTGHL